MTTDCYDPAQIVRMPMFILPPAQEWYYRKQHPDYCPLPPLHPGLRAAGRAAIPIEIVYPQPGRVLVAPKSLEGQAQSLVFTAIHRDRNAVLYWHIDDNYIARRPSNTKISVRPAPGAHRLTVIDEHGRGKASLVAADRSLWPLAGAEGLCAGCSVLFGGRSRSSRRRGFPEREFLGNGAFPEFWYWLFRTVFPFSEFSSERLDL